MWGADYEFRQERNWPTSRGLPRVSDTEQLSRVIRTEHSLWIFTMHTLPSTIAFKLKWAASSEFVSSSIPSWQILTAHAQPFRGARDLAFCLKVPLDSLLVWASSGGSGETARMRRLAWTFAARIGDKYQICLTRPKYALFYQLYTTALFRK